MRSRLERGPRLVEPDVAVGADAEDLQVDPTCRGDLPLVPRTLVCRVVRRAIQKVDALRRKLQQRKNSSPPISRRAINQAAKNAISN